MTKETSGLEEIDPEILRTVKHISRRELFKGVIGGVVADKASNILTSELLSKPGTGGKETASRKQIEALAKDLQFPAESINTIFLLLSQNREINEAAVRTNEGAIIEFFLTPEGRLRSKRMLDKSPSPENKSVHGTDRAD